MIRTAILVMFLALAARGVAAQSSARSGATGTTSAAPATSQAGAGWQDGFAIQSASGDYRLQIGALVQVDGRFALRDHDRELASTFLMRRVQTPITGRLAQHFEFVVRPDFAGGTVGLLDAYVDTRFSPGFILRVGKGKVPFGLERGFSASGLLLLERALPSQLTPNRDLGIQVLGDLRGGRLHYAAGVFNGVPDGASGDRDLNDSKDLAGRLAVRPFVARPTSPLSGLGVAIAGTTGREAALPVFRSTSSLRTFFSYDAVSPDGRLNRYSPQAFYLYRRVAALAEYVHTQQPIRSQTLRSGISHESWEISGSVLLTGGSMTERGVRPNASFDFGHGHVGAIQIAARYHTLRVDQEAFALGFASAASSRQARGWTVGLNWHLNPYVKYVLNFERTRFEGGTNAEREPEMQLGFRTQISF